MYGLIGYPLSHSFSPSFFHDKFKNENIDERYELFPIQKIEELNNVITDNRSLRGLNVTIPYKQVVIPLLNDIDDAAKRIGAVNCISIKNNILKGFNTDWLGFYESLKPLLKRHHTKALVLGTGGASKAVAFALDAFCIPYRYVSRESNNQFLKYTDLDKNCMEEHTIIINTTPLGMYPAINNFANIPYQYISTHHLLYDLIYNPTETLFLSKGKQQYATIKNGYEMLILQAEESWKIWKSMS